MTSFSRPRYNPHRMARLLIVDDDEADLLLLKSMLQDGHEIHTATNSDDALELYTSDGIDVVVTDIQMPEKDGIVLIEAIRAENPTAYIIAISGQTPNKLGIAQMAGASAILSKPLTPRLIRDAVARAVARTA